MQSGDVQVLANVLEDTTADAHTRRRLIQVVSEHRAIARFAQTALGGRRQISIDRHRARQRGAQAGVASWG